MFRLALITAILMLPCIISSNTKKKQNNDMSKKLFAKKRSDKIIFLIKNYALSSQFSRTLDYLRPCIFSPSLKPARVRDYLSRVTSPRPLYTCIYTRSAIASIV